MWKSSKKEEPHMPQGVAAPSTVTSTQPPPTATSPASIVHPKAEVHPKMADIAHIGKSVIIRGELSGSEDLYLDGEVEGSIELKGHSLTIGPNGHIRANVHAHEVVIHGRVEGNIRGTERVELKKTAILSGDIVTQRIMIEEGAMFKGSVDVQKGEVRNETKPESKPLAATAAAGAAVSAGSTFTPSSHTPVAGN